MSSDVSAYFVNSKIKVERQDSCSICHKLCNSNTLTVKEHILQLLKFLIEKINTTVLQNSLICEECYNQIMEAYQLKVVHRAYLDKEQKLDIKQEDDNDTKLVRCYNCKNHISENSFKPLFDVTSLDIYRYITTKADLETLVNPVICNNCQVSISNLQTIMTLLSVYKTDLNDEFIEQGTKVDVDVVEIKKEKLEIEIGDIAREDMEIKTEEVIVKTDSDHEDSSEVGVSGHHKTGQALLNNTEIIKQYHGHGTNVTKMFRCQQCEYQTRQKSCFNRHMMNHKGTSKRSQKTKHLTIPEKQEIIRYIDQNPQVSKREVGRIFQICPASVKYLCDNRDKYLEAIPERSPSMLKKTRLDKGYHPNLEQVLFEWFKQKRNLGIAVTGPLLRATALNFNTNLCGNDSFVASEGWCSKFKERFGIRKATMQGERLSAHAEGTARFKNELTTVIKDGNYDLDNVYNADETGLYYKCLPSRTLSHYSEKHAAGYKENKERVTVLTCANVTGSHRIPLLVIGKSSKPNCFRNISNWPVAYKAQKSAWMNRDIFVDWYTTVFIPSVLTRKSGDDEKFLLLLDNAPCHPSDEELNSLHPQFKILYLPPNATSIIQPMNQGVIECLKKHYKKIFLRKLLLHNLKNSDDLKKFLKGWTLLNTAMAIATAWSFVSQATLSNAWGHLLSGNLLPVVEDVNEILAMLNNITEDISYSKEELDNWIETDLNLQTCHELTDAEILCRFGEKTADENSDVQFDDNAPSVEFTNDDDSQDTLSEEDNISAEEAHNYITKFNRWYQAQNNCEEEKLICLNSCQIFAEKIMYKDLYESS